jgi:hypothetical protein
MSAYSDYLETLNDRMRGSQKALIRYLRSQINSSNSEIKQHAKETLKSEQDDIARGKRKKTYRDSVTGELKLRPKAGVGGGGIKSPDETARGRMSLLKKRQM